MHKYVEQVKQIQHKPEHVRHRIALGSSIAITALVGIIWLVGSATSGKFALTAPVPGEASEQRAPTLAETKSDFTQLLGSVGAAVGATSSQPAITVVDGGTSSTLDSSPAVTAPTPPSSATAIPF